MAREDVGLEVSPTGEITVIDNTDRQIAAMLPRQQTKVRQIMQEMAMVTGAMQTLSDEITYQERKLRESPLAVSLKKNKEKMRRIKARYTALVHGFNTLFDFATQDDTDTTLNERYERIFREMDEEEELIRKAEKMKGTAR